MDKKKQYIEIGKIVSIHGIKGFVKLEPWFDDVDIIKHVTKIYMDNKGIKFQKIEKISKIKAHLLIKFEEINNIDEAKKEIGKIVYSARKDLNLKKGEILIQDLIGMKIYDYENKDLEYGEIRKVLKTGANDVYMIENKDGKEKYIPVIKEVVKEKDYQNEKIYIKVLKGMFDV